MGIVPYIACGDGPPVVLIHGLGGFKESWGPLPAALAAAGMRALAVDLPGSGEAPRPRRRPVSSRLHADVLAPWIDALDAPVALVGHSLGAQVALMLARARPARVRALALLAPVVAPRPARMPRRLIDLLTVPGVGPPLARLGIALARRDPERRRSSFLSAAGDPSLVRDGSPEALLLQEAADRLECADLRAMSGWASSGLRRGAIDEARGLTVPTLLVAGARDRLCPDRDMCLLATALARPHRPGMDGVGHFPHLESPEVVLPALVSHLAGGRGASSPS